MLKLPTPKLLPVLLAASAALLLTACGATPPLSTPPAERFAPEPYPVVPAGEAQCDDDGDGVAEPCLSDRQSGELLNSVIDALDRANGKLQWLGDYFAPRPAR